MICQKCGTRLADDSAFCPACGTKVETIAQVLPEQPDAGQQPIDTKGAGPTSAAGPEAAVSVLPRPASGGTPTLPADQPAREGGAENNEPPAEPAGAGKKGDGMVGQPFHLQKRQCYRHCSVLFDARHFLYHKSLEEHPGDRRCDRDSAWCHHFSCSDGEKQCFRVKRDQNQGEEGPDFLRRFMRGFWRYDLQRSPRPRPLLFPARLQCPQFLSDTDQRP